MKTIKVCLIGSEFDWSKKTGALEPSLKLGIEKNNIFYVPMFIKSMGYHTHKNKSKRLKIIRIGGINKGATTILEIIISNKKKATVHFNLLKKRNRDVVVKILEKRVFLPQILNMFIKASKN